MKFKEIYKNLDSLYVSFRGTLREEMRETLEELKGYAQSEDEKTQSLASLTVDDHHFEVKDKGKGRYAYILADGWYHIQVSSSKRNVLPTVYVQVSSDLLHCFGPFITMSQLRGLIKELLVEIEEETISRADIFVDFITDVNLESIQKKAWVTRANNIHSYWKGNIYTGWSIGQGGVVSARLYNKTVEIEKSGKDYFTSIWQKDGWEKGQTVWRLEFQLRREILSQMSIDRVSDFIEGSNDVWKYCTRDWLRLASKVSWSNRTRQKTHWLWELIQKVKFGAGSSG